MKHVTLEVCENRTLIFNWEPVTKQRFLGTWTRVHAADTIYHVVSTQKLNHDACRAVVALYLSGRNKWVLDLNSDPIQWRQA